MDKGGAAPSHCRKGRNPTASAVPEGAHVSHLLTLAQGSGDGVCICARSSKEAPVSDLLLSPTLSLAKTIAACLAERAPQQPLAAPASRRFRYPEQTFPLAYTVSPRGLSGLGSRGREALRRTVPELRPALLSWRRAHRRSPKYPLDFAVKQSRNIHELANDTAWRAWGGRRSRGR